MKKIAWLLVPVLCLALLAGCGKSKNAASSGDVLNTVPVSVGDVTENPLQRAILLGGGVWHSEQTDAAGEKIVVRELTLAENGSFSYREGNQSSEFCYFLGGSWTLSGDVLTFHAIETDLEGNTLEKTLTAVFRCEAEAGNLTLTVLGETGFGDEPQGTAIHYYHAVLK